MDKFKPTDTGWDEEPSGHIGQSEDQGDTTIEIEDEVPLFDKNKELPDDDNDESAELIDMANHSMWSFAYYQQFFDVDTATVLKRIKRSFIPLPTDLRHSRISKKPDMYGPFWICATLVLFIAVFGNLSTLLSNFSNKNYKYKPQFELLPIAAIIIYCYTFVLPLLIKGYFWWRKTEFKLSVSQIICLYGYSMFICIPSSVLFIVPYAMFNWIVVAITTFLSGSVIVISLASVFRNKSKKEKLIFMLILFAVHATTIVILRLYFFSPNVYSEPSGNVTNLSATIKVVQDEKQKKI